MHTIFTHIRPDLDAATSVWAYGRFVCPKDEINLVFVPAGWNGADLQEEDVALDIEAGGKGLKGTKCSDGRVMSCFAEIVRGHCTPEEKEILRPMVEYVEAQDSTGDAVFELMKGFFVKMPSPPYTRRMAKSDVPAALRVGSLITVFRAIERLSGGKDHQTVLEMGRILDAIFESGIEYREAAAEAAKSVIVGPAAVLESSSKNPHIHARIFEANPVVRAIVRLDSPNLAVLRRNDDKANLGEIVRPFVEKSVPEEAKEWFYHSAGFLAARGGPKAPVTSPSKVDARKLAQHIAEILSGRK